MPCAGYTAVCERFCGVFSTEIFKSEQGHVYLSHRQHVDTWETGEKVGTGM